MPVVGVLALAPQTLEGILSLGDCHGIVEVPQSRLSAQGHVGHGVLRRSVGCLAASAVGQLACSLGFLLLASLLALFLLQFLYHAVDGSVALALGHQRQCLQRVLKVDGVGMRHQLVEHLGAFGELLIVVAVLVEHTYGRAVAAACVAELLHRPVQVAELEQQHTALNAASGGFLVALLIRRYGVGGVAVGQVDVAHGIVDLVQIVLVVVVGSHALEAAYHLAVLSVGQYLGHGDARVELQFVGRVLPYHVAEGVVGLLVVA